MKFCGFFAILIPAALYSQAPVLTYHNDSYRTGWFRQETLLTPSNVNSTHFGKLFTLATDGKVDAATLYVPGLSIRGSLHNVAFVVSEHDTVYAYDADNGGSPLWQTSMKKSGEIASDPRNCDQVYPEIGVTATPAIDLRQGTHGTMFVVAMTKDAQGNYHHRLHSLDITTGAEQSGGPVEVTATYPGNGIGGKNGLLTFDPGQYKERAALLITQGVVVTTWTSHCDFNPYNGWIMTYDESTLARKSILNFTPNGDMGGVWQSGGGPAADAAGNVYFLSSNGTFDTTLDSSGRPSSGDFGNSFLKISNVGNKLAVADYFAMSNVTQEDGWDQDLGSGGAMLLPELEDASGSTRQLAVGAGKDGNLYVVDRTNMGKFDPNSNHVYQEMTGALPGGIWSVPAYANSTVYFGAVADSIRAFDFQNGKFVLGTKTTHTFPYPGASPAISSKGRSNIILWAVENTSPAVLHAFDATNLTVEFYNSNQAGTRDNFGDGNKFITPVIAGGRVFVGTPTGVAVFGLLGSQSAVAGSGGSGICVFSVSSPNAGGLDVYQNLGDAAQTGNNVPFDFMSQVVGGTDGHCRINLEVQVDMVLKPGFPGENFLDALNTGDFESH